MQSDKGLLFLRREGLQAALPVVATDGSGKAPSWALAFGTKRHNRQGALQRQVDILDRTRSMLFDNEAGPRLEETESGHGVS